MVKEKRVSEFSESAEPCEVMITRFIELWEDHWPEAERYTHTERAMIRAHLYFAAARRYVATAGGELHFTKKELKRAVQSAIAVVADQRKRPQAQAATDMCSWFVEELILRWDRREEFSPQERVLIRARLYSDAMDRYQRSGLTDLRVTNRQIQKAVELVEGIRQRQARERRLDERDRNIRRRQRENGVLADTCTVMSE